LESYPGTIFVTLDTELRERLFGIERNLVHLPVHFTKQAKSKAS